MSDGITVRGGAQIGWVNATWPFAVLTVSAQQLQLTGWLLGTYTFRPDEIVAIERYGSIPVLATGVKVVHNNSKYPKKMIFWCLNPRGLIERIEGVGFKPSATTTLVRHEAMAFRWSFIVAVVVIWNGLFLLDGQIPWQGPHSPGPLAVVALAAVFLLSITLSRSPTLKSIALKPGRTISEVMPMVRLIQFVTGFLLVIFAFQHAIT